MVTNLSRTTPQRRTGSRRSELAHFCRQLDAGGGLFQIISHRGGSRVRWAIALADLQVRTQVALDSDYGFWISDEGYIYTPAWPAKRFQLSHLLSAYSPTPQMTWRLALEAVQTGLFRWAFLRSSHLCTASLARALQLKSERSRCRVFVLTSKPLPHWVLKASLEIYDEAALVLAD